MKKTISVLLAVSLLFLLCACGGKEPVPVSAPAPKVESTPQPMAEALPPDAAAEGSITIYAADNPDTWAALGQLYTERSGIPVALADSPESADFLIVDYSTLKTLENSCAAMDDYAAVSLLTVPSYSCRDSQGRIVGLPLELESVAVAVNTRLLETAGYNMERLDGWKALHRFSTSVNDRKEELGFSAWTSLTLSEGSTEKLTRYLFNLPVYAEMQESGVFTGKYVGDYRDSHYKDFFTMVLEDGVKTGNDVRNVTAQDALASFAAGEALFCIADSRDLAALEAMGMSSDTLDFVPAWMGMPGEENWGFVTDAVLYAAVRDGDPLAQHNAEDFLYWCLCDAETKELLSSVYDSLPFEGFVCSNALLERNAENDLKGLTPVPWLHRNISDPENWDSYFLYQLGFIAGDNVVWRWQVTYWKLVEMWNGQ